MTRIHRPRTDRRFGVACTALAALVALLAVRPPDAGALGPPNVDAGAEPPEIHRRVTTIAPGLTLERIVDREVPRRIFVLTVDRSQALTLDVTLALGDHLAGYAPTSAMAANAGAIAAVNGDFSRPPGHPLHPFAMDGNLVQTSVIRGFEFAPTLDESGAFFGRPQQTLTAVVASTGETLAIDRWNEGPPEPGEIAGFSPEGGDAEMPPPDACSVRLLPQTSPQPADPNGVERTYTVDQATCAETAMVVSGGVVLSAPPGTDEAIRLLALQPGAEVRLTWSFGWPDVFDAIGGVPILVADGQMALESCYGSVCYQHPRTGVGITADGKVLLVVVDGRQPRYSEGLTMRRFARLFLHLGATFAMNLDGGGSSTMVVNGTVVNRPSSGVERSVSSAIVILPGPDPGEVLPSPFESSPIPTVPTGPVEPGRAAIFDPGSTGGLLDALAHGEFGYRGPLPEDLMNLVRLFRARR